MGVDVITPSIELSNMERIKLIEKCNISTTTKKYVQVNENNQTSDEKVFAGGDVVGQNSTVAWAASDGKNVASKIIKFLEEK